MSTYPLSDSRASSWSASGAHLSAPSRRATVASGTPGPPASSGTSGNRSRSAGLDDLREMLRRLPDREERDLA